jgi:hemerythrin-like domain-containing protein
MSILSTFMKDDHRSCDEGFATMENAVADENWSEAKEKFEEFTTNLLHHFDIEEKVMFPAFEARSESAHCNPTPVMIMEHEQMRGITKDMREKLEAKDKNGFFGSSETLMMLMQQHNMKEEQMMYPMIDEAMDSESEMLLNEMKELPKS